MSLSQAVWRVSSIALEPFTDGTLTGVHWVFLVLWVIFMAYSEGYRGFQKKFSPRVVARAIHIGRHPTFLKTLFAPFICMGLGYATRKRLIISWCLVVGICGLVVAIQSLSQPWRGLIDAGVVVGLCWGIISLLWISAKAIVGHSIDVDPEVPASARIN